MKIEIEVPEFTVEYMLDLKHAGGVVDGEWVDDNNWDKIKYLLDVGCIKRSQTGVFILDKLGELILKSLAPVKKKTVTAIIASATFYDVREFLASVELLSGIEWRAEVLNPIEALRHYNVSNYVYKIQFVKDV